MKKRTPKSFPKYYVIKVWNSGKDTTVRIPADGRAIMIRAKTVKYFGGASKEYSTYTGSRKGVKVYSITGSYDHEGTEYHERWGYCPASNLKSLAGYPEFIDISESEYDCY